LIYISDAAGSVLNQKTEPKCQEPNRTDLFLKPTNFWFSLSFLFSLVCYFGLLFLVCCFSFGLFFSLVCYFFVLFNLLSTGCVGSVQLVSTSRRHRHDGDHPQIPENDKGASRQFFRCANLGQLMVGV